MNKVSIILIIKYTNYTKFNFSDKTRIDSRFKKFLQPDLCLKKKNQIS